MRQGARTGILGLSGLLFVCVITTTVAADPTYDAVTAEVAGDKGCGCVGSPAHEFVCAWAWNVDSQYEPPNMVMGIPDHTTDFVATVNIYDDNTDGIHGVYVEMTATFTVIVYSDVNKQTQISNDQDQGSNSYTVPANDDYHEDSFITVTLDPWLPLNQGPPNYVYAEFTLQISGRWNCVQTNQGGQISLTDAENDNVFCQLYY